jgi:uncharacterized protein YlxW (UPF0749 family)
MKKKYTAQISVALVCCILGFMLAYQFRILNKQSNIQNTTQSNTDLTVQIEQLNKQKDELQKNINDLQAKIKVYEDSAANKTEDSQALLKELENSRMLAGVTDVQGQGVVLYLNPNTTGLGTDLTSDRITDKHLVYVVNELLAAGAEAISINDIRLTPRSGIRSAGNYILVNEERISPLERITIKAIGDKSLLAGALAFPGVLSDFNSVATYKYEKQDNIIISKNKYTKSMKFDFAKPVKQ